MVRSMRQTKVFAATVESEVAMIMLHIILPPITPNCPHGQPTFLVYFACLMG